MNDKSSVVIVGGGVIGLSVAWELAQRGFDVTVVDREKMGRKASWAGAGILAPANSKTATQPMDKLMGLGSDLHKSWHYQLMEQTGIDNGYRECGGIYIAFTAGDKATLAGQKLNWADYEIAYEEIQFDHPDVQTLAVQQDWQMLLVPGESQIRNPAHLKALMAANERLGVRLLQQCDVQNFEFSDGRLVSISIPGKTLAADYFCFCTGAWSQELFKTFGIRLPLIPVRGQMLLFKVAECPFEMIVNVGSRYIVPRDDGYVLVGSTLEEVGFDESTTEKEINDLQSFASAIVPALTKEKCVQTWAGLRPATNDGFPFMGRLGGIENLLVATGHFRCGLQMSTAVAVMLADEIEGIPTIMDGLPFAPSRLARYEPKLL